MTVWLVTDDSIDWAWPFVGSAGFEDTPCLLDQGAHLLNSYDRGESESQDGAPFPWNVVVGPDGTMVYAQSTNDPEALIDAAWAGLE